MQLIPLEEVVSLLEKKWATAPQYMADRYATLIKKVNSFRSYPEPIAEIDKMLSEPQHYEVVKALELLKSRLTSK